MYNWKVIDKFLLEIGFFFQDELSRSGDDTTILLYSKLDDTKSHRIKIRLYVDKTTNLKSFFVDDDSDHIPSQMKGLEYLINQHRDIYRNLQLKNILDETNQK
jgi:hypothetical protein